MNSLVGLYVNNGTSRCFVSFGNEHISEELKTFIGNESNIANS